MKNLKKLSNFLEQSIIDRNKNLLSGGKDPIISKSFEYFVTKVCDFFDQCENKSDERLIDTCTSVP
jgi:hypothetical protein